VVRMSVPDADHDSLWYRGSKPYVYVSQPYGEVNDARLPRWQQWVTDHGLTLEFLPHYYFIYILVESGGTVLLLFKRASAEPARRVWGKDELEMPFRFAQITFTAESRIFR
jgi:hypothetical protein